MKKILSILCFLLISFSLAQNTLAFPFSSIKQASKMPYPTSGTCGPWSKAVCASQCKEWCQTSKVKTCMAGCYQYVQTGCYPDSSLGLCPASVILMGPTACTGTRSICMGVSGPPSFT